MSRPSRRHDLLIGIGHYTDLNISPLPTCNSDVLALGTALKTIKSDSNISPRQTILSTHKTLEPCQKISILRSLEEAISYVKPWDSILLCFSSHGFSYNKESFVVPSDGVLGDTSSFIPFAWIREMLDQCECTFKVILIDACHSGDANITFKDTGASLTFSTDSLNVQQIIQQSKGIAFATSCGHDQVALLRKDMSLSLWIGAIIDHIESMVSLNQDISVHQVIFDAAQQTMLRAEKEWGRKQTPYIGIKTEGIIFLGQTSTAN